MLPDISQDGLSIWQQALYAYLETYPYDLYRNLRINFILDVLG
jgi:hypothetical protein